MIDKLPKTLIMFKHKLANHRKLGQVNNQLMDTQILIKAKHVIIF